MISPVLGLLWLDHALNINIIAKFIREDWEWTPNWEEHYAQHAREHPGRFWVFAAAMTIVFFFPSVAGLIAAVSDVSGLAQIAPLGLAVLLTLLYLWSWADYVLDNWPTKDEPGEDERTEDPS